MINMNIEIKKILFLPHCLRKSQNCKAKIDKEGYNCVFCNKDCKVGIIKKYAEQKGYKVIIAPGGTIVKNIIKKHKPKIIIGICCRKEVELAFDYLKNYKGIVDYVELSKDGCVNTDVNLNKVYTKINQY
jgi:uncharacterized protein